MKKITLAVLYSIMTLIMVFASGCFSNNSNKSPIYLVSVVGGKGGGYYFEKDNCKITAVVPEGKQFLKWISDGEDISAEEEYIFEVVEDIDLVAVFNDKVDYADKKVYTIKTLNGIGDGGYIEGTDCTIKVVKDESDRSFKGWSVVDAEGKAGEIISEQSSYTFKVSKNVTLKAEFNDVRLATPNGTLCRISSTPSWGDVIVELDRVKDANGTALKDAVGNPATVFDGRIQYILIHVYDSRYAANSIATFKFVQNANISSGKLVTMDGAAEFGGINGGAGNYYRDWIGMSDWLTFFKAAIGENYSSSTTYYFASQLIAKDEAVAWEINGESTMQLFASSGISGLNNESFCEQK